MSTINDGGPAYPFTLQTFVDNGITYHETHPGKSLRAEFAGIFTAAMIANGGTVSLDEALIGERMCGLAVAIADTLIAELQKVPA